MSAPSKTIFAGEIRDRDQVDDLFLLKSAEIRQKKDSSPYIFSQIADASGTLGCYIWGIQGDGERVMQIASTLQCGAVYRICGQARDYNGGIQISVNEGIAELDEPVESIEPSDFISSPVVEEDLKSRILGMANRINDPQLRDLVLNVIATSDGYFTKPAAKMKHHEYPGGLAEHSLEVATIAASMAGSVRGENDADLVIAGALLHDIGKTSCFEQQGLWYTARPEYDLIGHVTLGVTIVSRAAGHLAPETASHLLHIIQSHHGPYGEVACQTPEAWSVHLADLSSATLREITDDQALLSAGTGTRSGKRIGGPVWRF
ncbi:HD domain-containing protein [Methanofollis fontis]|uniref:Phosphohydrolase n=1 Tax=Methanofollis fontis TaxID=2052832 RepID=A0A483CXB5_9EURY|nr:HD domain-containing protein [Methanofollis fontis]TAJ44509.1 phosphohydrolase [Methanofollis fontis]